MKVEVLEIHNMNVPNAKRLGNLRAYASIKIGPLTIHRVKLMKEPGKKAYVLPPQFESYFEGGIHYSFAAEWPEHWTPFIFDAVWAAYNEMLTPELAETGGLPHS